MGHTHTTQSAGREQPLPIEGLERGIGSLNNITWNFAQRTGFRIAFVYLCLYLVLCRFIEEDLGLTGELGLAPGSGWLTRGYGKLWAPIVVWIGKRILHVSRPLSYRSGGNSDGIYGYTQIFCFAVVAGVAATLWTFLDRRKAEHRKLYQGLRIWSRYALAFSLFSYGMIKVIPTQFFRLPSLIDLIQPYGDFSRFSVLWNFMGSSTAYTVFTGAVEVLAGSLLLFRRTTALGALFATGALVNVGVLDFCYGVPEKLDVIHLALLALVILGADFGRLLNVFVLNRPAVAAKPSTPANATWKRQIIGIVKFAIIAYILITTPLISLRIRQLYPARSPIYGIYEVDEFNSNGNLLPPLTIDSARWRRVVFESESDAWFSLMDDTWHYCNAKYNVTAKSLTLTPFGRSSTNYVLVYSWADTSHLVLQGTHANETIAMRVKRVDESDFRLLQSKFRWINGQP